jgi:NADH-quinone oxidoreductase subunit E
MMTDTSRTGRTLLGMPSLLTGTGDLFPDELRVAAKEIISRFPADRSRSALLPLLHLVQGYQGYVSADGIGFCAGLLDLTRAEVAAVASFYTMYKREAAGDFLVSVCTNTMCDSLGGQAVFDELSAELGVGHDETTSDGTITLEHAECLAACDFGPVLTVNYEFFDNVTPESALDLVRRLRAGERPHPDRGARLCTLREISRQLAGFPEDRPEALAYGIVGDPTVAGLRLARSNGIEAPVFDPTTPIVPPKEGS